MAGSRSHPYLDSLKERDSHRAHARVQPDSSEEIVRDQSQDCSRSTSPSRPSTDSWTVTQGSRASLEDGERFSVVQRASGIFELVELLGDADPQRGPSTPPVPDRGDSATPPPIAFHRRD